MELEEILSMFAEMGFATQDQREQYADELSVSFDNSKISGLEIKVQ